MATILPMFPWHTYDRGGGLGMRWHCVGGAPTSDFKRFLPLHNNDFGKHLTGREGEPWGKFQAHLAKVREV